MGNIMSGYYKQQEKIKRVREYPISNEDFKISCDDSTSIPQPKILGPICGREVLSKKLTFKAKTEMQFNT